MKKMKARTGKSQRGTVRENKLWLSCAKLKLSYVEVKVEVVVKVGDEIVAEARVQLLVRPVGGWVDGWVVR